MAVGSSGAMGSTPHRMQTPCLHPRIEVIRKKNDVRRVIPLSEGH